jgi:Protein of unknown function (DUF2778)
MQGIDATFDDLSFEGGDSPQRVLPKILPAAAAVALAGAVGVWATHLRGPSAPEASHSPLARSAASTEAASKPFGDIVIDANLLAELKRSAPAVASSQVASLEAPPPASYAPIPLPSLDAFPPAPPIPQAGSVPLPPMHEGPEIGEAPLPPPRPPELGAPSRPAAPERQVVQPSGGAVGPTTPTDNRNFLQKLFGLGLPSAPGVTSRPAVASAPTAPSAPAVSRFASPTGSAVAVTAPESRGAGRGPLFSFPSPFGGSAPASGFDRYTAVYDISARVVYLPDGTRLEAHSGLGDALDNPRYVSERARGPTPPHVYQLTLREGSFHGVQALRLNPIGEGGLYGRAGLLAHPFMLGPNGDSNGCVSVKDYDAFLRAYQNGQINKLVVVAKL